MKKKYISKIHMSIKFYFKPAFLDTYSNTYFYAFFLPIMFVSKIKHKRRINLSSCL